MSEKKKYGESSIIFETNLLKDAASHLATYNLKYPKGFSKELKNFMLDAQLEEKKERAITMERSAKIAASLQAYTAFHKIIITGALKKFYEIILEKTSSRTKLTLFAKTAFQIQTMLQNYPSRNFDGAELYFLDRKGMLELMQLDAILNEKLDKDSDKRRYGVAKLVKIINPNEVAHKYEVRYVGKHQQINRPESVDRYLDGHYEVWKNILAKNFREDMEIHNYDNQTKRKRKLEYEAELKSAQDSYRYIKENQKDLDVRIVGYSHEKIYPTLSYVSDKTRFTHLRDEVPNAIWFEPKPFRTDMKVAEYLKIANKAFGDVYFTTKESD